MISCECELGRVGSGDVLVTRVAGPALAQVMPRVSGVVAEMGGSTSHFASLARERGINAAKPLPGSKRNFKRTRRRDLSGHNGRYDIVVIDARPGGGTFGRNGVEMTLINFAPPQNRP